MDELFFRILTEKQKDLFEIIKTKKFFILVPPSKIIEQKNLTRNFYECHLFIQNEYDEKFYIDLHGKVLELSNNTFQTYMGYKKNMNFNIIDQTFMESMGSNVQVILIDNIIDESLHQITVISSASILKRELLRKCYTKEDYCIMFDNLITKNSNFEEIGLELTKLIDKLQINYVLIKGHVKEFSKFFRDSCTEYTTYLSSKLVKFKSDETFEITIFELAESLVFNKFYSYIFSNLKQFNLEEETSLRQKINTYKNEFSFSSFQLDQIYNHCKFKSAIYELNRLPNCFTPFEKMTILSNVNINIVKDVNELLEDKNKYKKNKVQISSNELVPIWIYILLNSKLENIITETQIIQDFNIKSSQSFSEEGFQIANLHSALEDVKKKDEDKKQFINMNPLVISVKVSSDINPYELYYKTSNEPIEKEVIPSTLGSFISNLNPFNK